MEEIKNFIYSHSSPNGCVALTRSERDELIKMIEKHCEKRMPEAVIVNKDTPMRPYYDQGKELHRVADALEILASTVNKRGSNTPRLLVSNNGN